MSTQGTPKNHFAPSLGNNHKSVGVFLNRHTATRVSKNPCGSKQFPAMTDCPGLSCHERGVPEGWLKAHNGHWTAQIRWQIFRQASNPPVPTPSDQNCPVALGSPKGSVWTCHVSYIFVLFCFVLFGLQLSLCLWWRLVPLRGLSAA